MVNELCCSAEGKAVRKQLVGFAGRVFLCMQHVSRYNLNVLFSKTNNNWIIII